MKLLKLISATMEVARQFKVLFAERAQAPDQLKKVPQASTQTASNIRRKRR